MWFFNGRGPSGFSASSTAEEVTHGIDGTGLTAIVTGASTGIGAETARALSLRGVHVIMAVRLSNFFFHSRVVFSCDCLMSDLDMKVSIDNTTSADYTLVKVDSVNRPGILLEVVQHCEDKGYSVVNVQCKDRSNLLFDIVCTLTDMEYVVFHASISSDGPYAHQEYYICHMDGSPVNTEGEKARVIKCLEAAIRRRVCEGLSLELCARDKVGLLSEVTRILRENGLSVSRADVTTVGERAKNVFYVRDTSGNPVDMNTIEGLRKEIGQTMMLNVKKVPNNSKAPESKKWAKTSFFFGGLLEKFLRTCFT